MQAVEGYVDLQVNGYVGVDFNDPKTEQDAIVRAAIAMQQDGVVAALPTIITAEIGQMCRCICKIVSSIRNYSAVADVFRGVHIEGPFFPKQSGYIGAHPPQHALTSSLDSMRQLLEASEGYCKLLTLAPEVDFDGKLTRLCVDSGCRVAAGHTNASLTDLSRCVDEGLTMFTHLGNGCPRLMDRHDNIIYRALSLKDYLNYTLIADSFHVPELLFRNLLDWVPLGHLCVVSDAISATGLGPGEYALGERTVKIGVDKAARDASGEHFVGAASSMHDADAWLEKNLGLNLEIRTQLLRSNPIRFCQISD